MRLYPSSFPGASRRHSRPDDDRGGRPVPATAPRSRREAELHRQLEQARDAVEARFQSSVVAQATLGPDGVLVAANPALCRLTGYSEHELLGRSVRTLLTPEDSAADEDLRRQGTAWRRRLLHHADGHVLETLVSVLGVCDEVGGEVVRLEAVVQDISALAAAERELHQRESRWQVLAMHAFDVAVLCDREARVLFVTPSSRAVFGHRVEDVLGQDGAAFVHPDDVPRLCAAWALTAAAATGTTSTVEVRVRHADGGWRWVEESLSNRFEDSAVRAMVVNLVDVSERKAAESVVEQLAGKDAPAGGTAAEGRPPSGAADAAVAEQSPTDPARVVRAMPGPDASRRDGLEADLRRALARDEFVTHFQPIVTLDDGRPVAAEALVRWSHPLRGLLLPGAFIDVAEDSGLVVDIGARVLRQACFAVARWAEHGTDQPFYVSVNLSAKQLVGADVLDVVVGALADSGAAPRHLQLEVTESAVLADLDAAVATLQRLRDLGIAIAVDDFGTGYSSLTYLKRFPVTALKIDRSFVDGLAVSSDDVAIVTSVVDLARALGLSCVAEGVETEPQRAALQAAGCRYGQGHLWSHALDEAAFQAWLRACSQPTPVPAQSRTLDRRRLLTSTSTRTSPARA